MRAAQDTQLALKIEIGRRTSGPTAKRTSGPSRDPDEIIAWRIGLIVGPPFQESRSLRQIKDTKTTPLSPQMETYTPPKGYDNLRLARSRIGFARVFGRSEGCHQLTIGSFPELYASASS